MNGNVLGKVALAYSEDYLISLGGLEKLHPFDIHKYARITERLEDEGFMTPDDYFVPTPVDDETLQLVHTPEYLETLNDPATLSTYLEAPALRALPRRMLRNNVVGAFRHATGGSILAARLALDAGIGINVAGGYHHAGPGQGEGFNIFNDIAIAIEVLRLDGLIERALVVDLDVHQGNGTAVCFAGDDAVFTFSVHQGDIYPIPKARSDLDVEVSAGTADRRYLEVVSEHWPDILERTSPDLVVYQAGCDVLADDPLASLEMTHRGVMQRDATVIDECVDREIPALMLLGGGYSADAWEVQYGTIRRTLEQYGRSEAPS